MSLRIFLLGLAVAICALWPQGLVLCVGEPGHVELEPGCTPCCPADRTDQEQDGEGSEDCRDFESPELTSSTPAPAMPAPCVLADLADLTPDASPASANTGLTVRSGPDDLRTVIQIV